MIAMELKKAQLISNFKKPVDLDSIFVADSALYTAENLLAIKNLKWITRVPLSIKAAQLYVRDLPESQFNETDIEGYKAVERESNYGGIQQRWIIIDIIFYLDNFWELFSSFSIQKQ